MSAGKITAQTAKGEKIVLDVAELKAVLGDRLIVACLNPNVIAGTRGSLMIPANEPCPKEPHNHDGSLKEKFFEKVLVFREGLEAPAKTKQ